MTVVMDEMFMPEEVLNSFVAEVEAARQSMRLACFEALDSFAPFGVLNCTGDFVSGSAPDDFVLNPPPDEVIARAGEASQTVGDPTQGPTGSLASDFVELAAGPQELAWFSRPMTINFPEALYVQSVEDTICFTPISDGPQFCLLGYDDLADPAELTASPPLQTVPFPEDFDMWLDQLPIDVVERTELDLGAAVLRYRLEALDPGPMVDAVGEPYVLIAVSEDDRAFGAWGIAAGIADTPEGFPEGEPLPPAFSEQQIYSLWLLRPDAGPTLGYVTAFGEFDAGEIEFAESVLTAIAFE